MDPDGGLATTTAQSSPADRHRKVRRNEQRSRRCHGKNGDDDNDEFYQHRHGPGYFDGNDGERGRLRARNDGYLDDDNVIDRR